nr:hypothetical protein [Tanacetum cinerariifolium]
SKLLSINSINSQHLDKKEQPAERRNRSKKSLQDFRVIHKSSISSQISSIHSIAPILSTKEPEHLLSMGYEHFSITPEMESNEVTESNAENLLPIPSKCEGTDNDDLDFSNDESLSDKDVPVEEFKIYLNPLCNKDEINSDKLDPHCFNVEYDFDESLLHRDTFIDFSSKFDFSGIKPEIPKSDFDFEEEIRLIENFLYDNSFLRPPKELNAEIADTIIESIPLPIPVQDEEVDLFLSDNSIPPGIENIVDDPEGDIRFLEGLLIDDSILSHESFDSSFEDSPLISRPPPEPPDDNFDLEPEPNRDFLFQLLSLYVSFCFENEPDQERLINHVENDILDNSSNDPLLEEADLFLVSDNSIPPEPPDDNFDLGLEVISAVMEVIDEPGEHFNPGGEIFVSTNNEDVDYFPFMFVIQFFLSYLILLKISPLLLSAESEDTIFDPGISD